MSSYVGPAHLVVDGTVHDVAVNVHTFVDLAAGVPKWRGVVVDAGFLPPADARPAEVRLPDGRGLSGTLVERRIEGGGRVS